MMRVFPVNGRCYGCFPAAWFWDDNCFIHLKSNVMAPRDRSIGSDGLEQGGANLGNDYSRNITREKQQDDTLNIVVPKERKEDKEEKDTVKKEEE